MSMRRSRRFDRRQNQRRSRRVRALVGGKRLPADSCENAVIEEVSNKGLRIVSGSRLNAEDSVVLYVGAEEKPLPAKVAWSKKEGVIEKRGNGRPGQAWVAGLRMKTQRRPRKAAPKNRFNKQGQTADKLIKAVFITAGLALAGLVLYGFGALFSLLG